MNVAAFGFPVSRGRAIEQISLLDVATVPDRSSCERAATTYWYPWLLFLLCGDRCQNAIPTNLIVRSDHAPHYTLASAAGMFTSVDESPFRIDSRAELAP